MAGLKIKKGDMVQVISGKYKGKVAKVLKAFPVKRTLVVEGINEVKKHKKPRKKGDEGGIVTITLPIRIEKIMLVDTVTKKPTRVGMKLTDGQKKVRVSKHSGEEI